MLAKRSPQMKKPVDKLLELNQDADARALFEGREKQRRDNMAFQRRARMEGIQEGIQKGRQEGIFGVAKKMLEMNMPVEDIARATGLTIEEIKG
jgi:predicted transposase/invertase (TIGR01784 family)